MARLPRFHRPGVIFHAMSKGNGGKDIFESGADWREFLGILSEIKNRNGFELFAYCLMPNHFHLLVRVNDFSISRIMQQLLTRYSKYFNSRHNQSGHVFQGRFKALLCDRADYLLELIRYIHMNPVRAGLVRDAVDWPWSGHRELVSTPFRGLLDPAYPLALFGQNPEESVRGYLNFLQTGNEGTTFSIANRFAASIRQEDPESDGVELDDEKLLGIAVDICERTSIRLEDLRGSRRRPDISKARHAFIRRSAGHGFRPSGIAAFLNRSPAAVSKVIHASREVES